MADLLLGIDIGTYSSKGVLCRPDGEILAESRQDHSISIPQPGFVEQDADEVWWADFVTISVDLTSKVPAGDRIAGLAVSAIGACVLPVDEIGKPLRPGILYGVDTRASSQINDIENRFSRKEIIALGGTRLTSQAIGPKILWIKQNEPEIYAKATKFITSTSYLVYKLTNRFVIDCHTATEFTPLINIHSMEWDDRFAKDIVDLDKLPDLGWCDEIAGFVDAKASKETGIPEGTPVTFGSVDAVSEAVSVGVVDHGDLMIMYGSTAFMIFIAENPVPTEELWLEAGAFKGQYVYSAGLSTSGSITTWMRDQFAKDCIRDEEMGGENAYAVLGREAALSAPGANGLLYLPYMSGERTPIHDPKARGIIAGLNLGHKRGDIYRSVLEGTAFAIRNNLEAMQKAGAVLNHGVAVGGGASNELWVQIVSDISGIPQRIPDKTIGASYGDAFLAGLAAGVIDDMTVLTEDWVHIEKEIIPNRSTTELYAKQYQLFTSLYSSTKELVHELVDLHSEQ